MTGKRSTFAFFLTLSLLSACRPTQSNVPRVESDQLRIVSLAPSLTEILFELGAGEQIVGVTSYCDFPPEAQTKEKIGDFLHPNLEKIVHLKPGLVVAEHWPSSKTVPRLRQFGLPILELPSPRSLEDIYHVIRELGTAVQRIEQAETIISNMKGRVAGIQKRAGGLPHQPTVYIEIDLPSWTIGKQSFINEALALCGLRNIFADVERPALQASKEAVITRNPDLIFSFTVEAEQIRQRPGWHAITAVQKSWIIDDLNEDLLSHANHRLVEGMEELQERVLRMISETERRP